MKILSFFHRKKKPQQRDLGYVYEMIGGCTTKEQFYEKCYGCFKVCFLFHCHKGLADLWKVAERLAKENGWGKSLQKAADTAWAEVR